MMKYSLPIYINWPSLIARLFCCLFYFSGFKSNISEIFISSFLSFFFLPSLPWMHSIKISFFLNFTDVICEIVSLDWCSDKASVWNLSDGIIKLILNFLELFFVISDIWMGWLEIKFIQLILMLLSNKL